jgi:uncharacterized membrane protein HdeD (DUF308 family)
MFGRRSKRRVIEMLLVVESSRHWWTFLLRGLAAVLFGVLAFAWPSLTLTVLVLFWGAYALVDGVLALVAAFRTQHDHRWWLLLEGIVGIGAGVVTFVYPDLTALVLVYIIGAWALITGVLELVAAVRLRRIIENEFWLVLGGIASVLFGVVLFVAPGAGALALVWLIAAYAIVFGVLMIGLSLRLHGASQRRQAMGTA